MNANEIISKAGLMKRLSRSVTLLFVAAFLMVGCGSSDVGNDQNTKEKSITTVVKMDSHMSSSTGNDQASILMNSLDSLNKSTNSINQNQQTQVTITAANQEGKIANVLATTDASSVKVKDIPGLMVLKGWNTSASFMKRWFDGVGGIEVVAIDNIKSLFGDISPLVNSWKNLPLFLNVVCVVNGENPVCFESNIANSNVVKSNLLKELRNANDASSRKVLLLGGSFNFIDQELTLANNTDSYDAGNNSELKLLHYVAQQTLAKSYGTVDEYVSAYGNAALRLLLNGRVSIDAAGLATIYVSELGVYGRDGYDFIGDQLLGYWSYSYPYVYSLNQILHGLSQTRITNADFRAYNDNPTNIKKGKDYRIFSTVERQVIYPEAKFTYQLTSAELAERNSLINTPPVLPVLSLAGKTSSSVSLQWTTPATATYFVLNRSGVIANRTGSSFVDSSVSSNTSYSYTLRACNATGCSAETAPLYVTTDALAPVIPGVPALSLAGKTASSVSLQWTTPATATYFVLNRSGVVSNRTGSSFVDSSVSANTSYSYTLRACNATGCSAETAPLYVTTDALVPAIPGVPGLSLAGKTASSVSLQWTTPANATYFVLNRSGAVSNRTGSSFVDSSVSANTTYSYTLRACNATGCSAETSPLYVTTDALMPVVNSVSLYNFNSANQNFYYGIYPNNNTVAIINGTNLSQTTVIDIVGYSCNISAPLTESNFYKLSFYTTGVYSYSNKYTYPSTAGFANQLAAVCSGSSTPSSTSVTVNVKSVSGGANIYTMYATVQ